MGAVVLTTRLARSTDELRPLDAVGAFLIVADKTRPHTRRDLAKLFGPKCTDRALALPGRFLIGMIGRLGVWITDAADEAELRDLHRSVRIGTAATSLECWTWLAPQLMQTLADDANTLALAVTPSGGRA
jgi:hypothetical protein